MVFGDTRKGGRGFRKVCALLHLFPIMKDKMFIVFVFFTLSITVNAQKESASTDIENFPKVNLTKDSLKVLHIGNSFTENSTCYLSKMVKAAGIDAKNMCLYTCIRGGGSFSSFINCWNDNDKIGYAISKVVGGVDLKIASSATPYDGSNLRKAFTECKWDLIVIQQVSHYSYLYDLWNKDGAGGHLQELINLIRTYQPQAAIGANLNHASYMLGNNTYYQFLRIADSYRQFCNDYGIDFVIPYGTAIQNIRQSSINTTRYGFSNPNDQHHLASGVGQYVANAAYFTALITPRYGVSIIGNSYRVSISDSQRNSANYPDELISVTDENAYLCQKSAVLAVHDMFNINNPDNTSILTDGEAYTNSSQLNNQKIFYARTFNNTKWQSLYIPFSMGYDDWKDEFDVAYINGIRQIDTNNDNIIDKTIMDIEKIEEGSLIPNTPYLIKAKTIGKKTITVNDVSLYPAGENSIDCSTTIAKYTFTGTYRTIPASVLLENEYYAMGGDAIIMTNGNSGLNPFRWYMKIEARSSMYYSVCNVSKAIAINVVCEDETTGVEELRVIRDTYQDTQVPNDKLPIYELNGRMVNENSSKPGVYIKNRKKIIIK